MRRAAAPWLTATLGAISLLIAAELALHARYRRHVLPPTLREQGYVTIVALGDSITAGWPGPSDQAWPALIEARLGAEYPDVPWQIVNAGAPGNTAPMGYLRFNREVAAHAPQVVLIAFGLNDCNLARHALDRWYERRVPVGAARCYLWRTVAARLERWGRQWGWLHRPTAEVAPQPFPRTTPDGFSAALAALAGRSRDIGARSVLLTTTPLAAITAPDVQIRADVCAGYNDRTRAVANTNRVPLVDLAAGHGADLPAGAFMTDGIHLTAAGQQWTADQIYTTLAAAGLWRELARRAR